MQLTVSDNDNDMMQRERERGGEGEGGWTNPEASQSNRTWLKNITKKKEKKKAVFKQEKVNKFTVPLSLEKQGEKEQKQR